MAEKDRLDLALSHARSQFSRFLWHIPNADVPRYWGDVQIMYYPYYSLEETLCVFGDQAGRWDSMLASVERVCGYLTGGKVTRFPELEEAQRLRVLQSFALQPKNTNRKPTCLISYSSKDEQFTKRLYDDLKATGFECWFAPHDLPIGARIRASIDDAIQTYDKVLLVISQNSIQSTWVEKEVETTFEREATSGETLLLPIRLDSEVLSTTRSWAADIRRQRNIGDFSGWQDEKKYLACLEKLIASLNS